MFVIINRRYSTITHDSKDDADTLVLYFSFNKSLNLLFILNACLNAFELFRMFDFKIMYIKNNYTMGDEQSVKTVPESFL